MWVEYLLTFWEKEPIWTHFFFHVSTKMYFYVMFDFSTNVISKFPDNSKNIEESNGINKCIFIYLKLHGYFCINKDLSNCSFHCDEISRTSFTFVWMNLEGLPTWLPQKFVAVSIACSCHAKMKLNSWNDNNVVTLKFDRIWMTVLLDFRKVQLDNVLIDHTD